MNERKRLPAAAYAHTSEHDAQPSLYDRLAIGAVLLLIAIFAFTVVQVTVNDASAHDDLVAKRDDNSGPGNADDDDNSGPGNADDDTRTPTGDTTPTGTTRGTGPSNTATNDTRTGTRTRGR
jgi:hypothetical protein